ncbi:hypothetical protein SAMN05660337_1921 [Maridesulfovibrio ferrireducens]|uniref:Uncharacterized protein n=1 Tax=Maridesulfovibrio ferrireducens TaxID=246191 RepID=A0A1G9GXP1_9BACT|nr:hypothetical protein [Maridesulfovibrio ferrireducens]SDL05480.1 hypothetical protein SAMN05660337_1921 [Maridesulfovibrio ferrireducens]
MKGIDYHFTGPVFENHTVSLDILTTTLDSLNRALSRAYLDVHRHGGVIKNAQMNKFERENFIFTAELPLGQSWFQSIRAGTLNAEKTVERFMSSILPPYEKAKERGLERSISLARQAHTVKENIYNESLTAQPFENFLQDGDTSNNFGQKSIAKYQSKMVSPMINLPLDNKLELTMHGNKTHTLEFDGRISKNFHTLISSRDIGNPVIFQGNIQFIHANRHSGDFYNTITHRTSSLRVTSNEDFMEIHPYTKGQTIQFIGAPVIEYGTIDRIAGDIYFIKFLREL